MTFLSVTTTPHAMSWSESFNRPLGQGRDKIASLTSGIIDIGLFERFGISMYCYVDLSLNFGIFRTTNALQIKGTLGMIFRPLPCLFRGCTAP
jgi:hypothetical protein